MKSVYEIHFHMKIPKKTFHEVKKKVSFILTYAFDPATSTGVSSRGDGIKDATRVFKGLVIVHPDPPV